MSARRNGTSGPFLISVSSCVDAVAVCLVRVRGSRVGGFVPFGIVAFLLLLLPRCVQFGCLSGVAETLAPFVLECFWLSTAVACLGRARASRKGNSGRFCVSDVFFFPLPC